MDEIDIPLQKSGTSVWKIALGVFFGIMLVVAVIIAIAVVNNLLGQAASSKFDQVGHSVGMLSARA